VQSRFNPVPRPPGEVAQSKTVTERADALHFSAKLSKEDSLSA